MHCVCRGPDDKYPFLTQLLFWQTEPCKHSKLSILMYTFTNVNTKYTQNWKKHYLRLQFKSIMLVNLSMKIETEIYLAIRTSIQWFPYTTWSELTGRWLFEHKHIFTWMYMDYLSQAIHNTFNAFGNMSSASRAEGECTIRLPLIFWLLVIIKK